MDGEYTVPRRFTEVGIPSIWGQLMPEIWSTIIDPIPLFQRKGMILASRWFRDLYWDNKRTYNISTPVLYDIPKKLDEQALDTAYYNLCRIFSLSSSDVFTTLKIYHVALGDRMITYLIEECFPSKLQHLHLEGCEITGHSVAQIAKLVSLKSLVLRDHILHDVDMVHITSLTRLKKLELSECNITDFTLLYLAGFHQLEKCKLMYTHHEVWTRNVEGPSKYIEKLGDCSFYGLVGKPFTSLSFIFNTPVTYEGLAKLDTSRLKTLRIECCSFLSKNTIPYLATITSLEKLCLKGYELETSYTSLTSLTNLKELNLCDSLLEDQDLVALSTLPSLETLNISGCRNITDDGLNFYMDNSVYTRKVHYLIINECHSLIEYSSYDCMIYDNERNIWRCRPTHR